MKWNQKTTSSSVTRMNTWWSRIPAHKTTFTITSSAATSRISNPNATKTFSRRITPSLKISSIFSNGLKTSTSRSNSETTSISFTSAMPIRHRVSRKKPLARKKPQGEPVTNLYLNVMINRIPILTFRKEANTIFIRSPNILSKTERNRIRTTFSYETLPSKIRLPSWENWKIWSRSSV